MSSSDILTPTQLDPEQIKVLLAEDDSTQRLALQRLVRCERYQTLATSDGGEALKHILADHFDILLTDLDMPGLNGEELCRKIREANLPHYVYIVILSANVEDQNVAAGLSAGADDFLRKPVAPAELIARLRNASRMVHLIKEQRRHSITDELTQLYNRRYLTSQLRYETFRAKRHKHPLSVLMFDIDHFKHINDQHGHPVGDQVLQQFAQTIRPLLRQSDWLARYGGEEFVAVLPEVSLEQALLTAERVLQQLNQKALHTARAGPLHITVSIGVAALASDNEDSDTLLARADEALYHSKTHGRNRVTASPIP